ncbi:WD40 repeat domain-containing protein [Salinimonas chungwhensis]|uniref:WD40 repeat domain-containing protein n=1 Tax=Salinimonas chungwhensis TaxID=265425 RepID=UPI0003769D77|nr:hypothetical protein [Salinimonas chungwhensis]
MKLFKSFHWTGIAALTVCLLPACSGPDYDPEKQWLHGKEGIYAADISSDGTLAVVSGVNNGIDVWQVKASEPMYHWSHQGEAANLVNTIHISADKKVVVTSDREAFALWSLESGEPMGFWRIDTSTIRDVAVANDGKGILVGRSNGKAMYFEPETGRRLEFFGHQEKINSVDISPNGKYALTGSNDYVAYLWSTDNGQIIHTFTHPSRVTLVALDDEGRYAFTAGSQKKSQIWNVQTGAPVANLQYIARQKIFTDAVFSEDGNYLLTGSPTRSVDLWDVATGESVAEWKVTPKDGASPPSAVVYAVGFAGPQSIVSESSSGLAELWEFENE